MSQKSLSTDLDEPIAKAMAAGLNPVAKVFTTFRDILERVEKIEAANSVQLAGHAASAAARGAQ